MSAPRVEAFGLDGHGLRRMGPLVMIGLEDHHAEALRTVFDAKVRGRRKHAVTRTVWIVSAAGLTGYGNVLTLTHDGVAEMIKRLRALIDRGGVAPDDLDAVRDVIEALSRVERRPDDLDAVREVIDALGRGERRPS